MFINVPTGVPGAPADWDPPEGMEQHTPVLFLDLNADDFSTGTCTITVAVRALKICKINLCFSR